MATEKQCDKSGRAELLRTRQAYPLKGKIVVSQQIIKDFVNAMGGADKCVVSFSGGKDSTVLLHLVRQIYPTIKGVFLNTGLEYPEVVEFVKTCENIDMIRPETTFKDVIEKYGYPFPSKEQAKYVCEVKSKTGSQVLKNIRMGIAKDGSVQHCYTLSNKWKWLIDADFKVSDKCCYFIKKKPLKKYQKQTGRFCITGIMAGESRLRLNTYLRNGCNIIDGANSQSRPLIHWNENDIWDYAKMYNLRFSEIYYGADAANRTGCMFCMFGVAQEQHEEGTNRFLRMERTHPKLHKYCIEKLGVAKVLSAAGIPWALNSCIEGLDLPTTTT